MASYAKASYAKASYAKASYAKASYTKASYTKASYTKASCTKASFAGQAKPRHDGAKQPVASDSLLASLTTVIPGRAEREPGIHHR
ncbi:hypothetical protein [Bradyrhizobium sp.]|uniref:hypothetical protein n=1 Tax=Bradyrhizobium sp. TaxID=376 RepID=UPI003C57BCEB